MNSSSKKIVAALLVLGAVVAGSSTSTTAGAQEESLESKEKWANQDQYMKKSVDPANEACGSKMTHSFDKKSFEKEDWSAHSPYGFCSSLFDDIAWICRNVEGAKERVAKKIKHVHCKYGGKGKFSGALSKSGRFNYSVDWEESNIDEKLTTILKKSL